MMAILGALCSGILLSLAPGPGSTSMLLRARESTKKAMSSIVQILLADVILLLLGAGVFVALGTEYAGFQGVEKAAGVFLIGFALYSFFRRPSVSPVLGSPFFLTLSNPAAWLASLGILRMALNASSNWWVVVGFEVGFVLGLLLIAVWVVRLSERRFSVLLKGVILSMAVMGGGLLVS